MAARGRKDLGDAAGARPLLERALRIDEKTFGPDHPNVATRLSNLAVVLQDLGDATEMWPGRSRCVEKVCREGIEAMESRPSRPGGAQPAFFPGHYASAEVQLDSVPG